MKSLAYHPAASAELEAEIAFCEAERHGAGSQVRTDIAITLMLIREFPRIGRRNLAGGQRIVTRHYRYVIHYELLEDKIAVWAIAHPAREPGYWLSRRLP